LNQRRLTTGDLRLYSFFLKKFFKRLVFIQPGETPLSTVRIFWVIPLYWLVLKLCTMLVSYRGKPFDLNWVVIVHNSLLSIASGALLLALAGSLLPLFAEHGVWNVFCDQEAKFSTGRHIWFYYINYMFKFWELFDTVLLALRGKPMPFLHTYHHAATLVLCWTQLSAGTCLQWVVICLNLCVHFIMYMYYALHALGVDVWWKRYLTMFQITQFVIALIACVVAYSSRILYDFRFLQFPQCYGRSHEHCIFGVIVLSSYLLLFLDLYGNRYAGPKSKGKKKISDSATLKQD